jgi:hypothetical protein
VKNPFLTPYRAKSALLFPLAILWHRYCYSLR